MIERPTTPHTEPKESIEKKVKSTKKEIVDKLIESLIGNSSDWSFGDHCAINKELNVDIWIANAPILDTKLYRPVKINFSLFDKIRLYRALSECRCNIALTYISKEEK